MEVVQGWHYDHGRFRSSVALDETDLARMLVNASIPAARLKDMPEALAFKLLYAQATLFNHNSYLRFLREQNAQDSPDARTWMAEALRAKKERDELLEELRQFKPAKKPAAGKPKGEQETEADGQ